MKKLALMICCAVLAIPSMIFAGDPEAVIEVGDTRAFVIEILGDPDGSLGGGGREILYYKRGKVELEGGKVKAVDLVSESEAARREQARIEAEEERRLAADRALKLRQTAQAHKPAKAAEAAPAKPPESHADLTKEQQAELDRRIEEGIGKPPGKASSRKFRKYRRGRSPGATEKREQQITEQYLAELAAGK